MLQFISKRLMVVLCTLFIGTSYVFAQCVANPTYTVSGISNANFNVNSGQTLVITATGVFSGSINLNGGTLCNQGTIQASANLNANGGRIYNYGTINRTNFSTGSGLQIYNYSRINVTGDLMINSGVYWWEDGMTTVNGNLHFNGTVTGSTNICGGFQVGNQTVLNSSGNVSQVDVCDWGMPANGFDVRNGTVGAGVTYCSCTYLAPPTPLPIELISFNAKCEGTEVNIDWSTASEQNNDHFLIQSSTDMIDWNVEERIPGALNSNNILQYSVTVPSSAPLAYYRLVQVDVDGTEHFFDPTATTCQFSSNLQFLVFPNPATDFVQLQASDIKGDQLNWSLTSVSGMEVSNGQLPVSAGSVDGKIQLTGISAGLYLLRAGNDLSGSQAIRVIVR